jgi:hypothetical protein
MTRSTRHRIARARRRVLRPGPGRPADRRTEPPPTTGPGRAGVGGRSRLLQPDGPDRGSAVGGGSVPRPVRLGRYVIASRSGPAEPAGTIGRWSLPV